MTIDHDLTTGFDAVTTADMVRAGSKKWSTFPGTIGAFLAEMDFGVAPEITSVLHEQVSADAFGYLPESMAGAMSSACADWQSSRYGWSVAATDVHPLADVIKGLEVAIEHCSAPGSAVIVPTPAYMPFLQVPATLGRRIIEVPLALEDDRYVMDLDALDAAFTQGGGLLILCNPHNPVGRVFDRDELLAIAEVVQRHGGRVFADEVHAPLVYAGGTHVPYASISPAAAAQAVTATSASKAWNLPGLKCAQIILSNDPDRETWAEIGELASHGAGNLGVVANTTAYRAGGPWLESVLDYLDGNRRLLGDLLAEQLPELGYQVPQGTYIGWLDCRRLGVPSPADFFRKRAGVSMTDGVACGSPGFVRLVFATSRQILTETVSRMAAAVLSRPGAG